MLKVVSAMRIPLTMMIIAIAMLASPLAYGQARTSGKPPGPAVGGGDRSLIPLIEGHEKQVSRVARRRQEYLDSDR